MTQDDTTERLVAELLQQEMGLRDLSPSDYTRDIKSFGIAGDDAVAFMRAYRTRFAVNLDAFSFARYFDNEGLSLSAWLLHAIGIWPKLAALSIRDLAAAAHQGVWPSRIPQMVIEDRRLVMLSRLALGLDIVLLVATALGVRAAIHR